MTFADYWDRLRAATPGLGNDENRMTLSVLNFRIAISKAYAAGRDEAQQDRDQGPVEQPSDRYRASGDVMDVFRDIFRGKR